MTKSELTAKMQENAAYLPGKTVKLDFGGDADTTIKISWADWQAMADGQLDGMTAFMTGKLKVEGDMSNAMQLQGVLSKLRG